MSTLQAPVVRCKVVKTPRPAFPWKVEALAPYVSDTNINYYFRTKEEAHAEIKARNWVIAKPVAAQQVLPMIGEFVLIAVLLFPLVYLMAKNSALEEILNPYTGMVLSVMVASFIYPTIKLIHLLLVKVDTLADLVPLGVYLILAIGFLYFFLAMFSQKPPHISKDPNRKSQYGDLAPGTNPCLYMEFSRAAAGGKVDPSAPVCRRLLFYAYQLWNNPMG